MWDYEVRTYKNGPVMIMRYDKKYSKEMFSFVKTALKISDRIEIISIRKAQNESVKRLRISGCVY